MGELFWNKVAAAILSILLVIMGLRTLAEEVFHVEDQEGFAYPIDLASLEGATAGAAEEPEEEGPVDFGVLLASADLGAGERVARRCAACHTFEEGGANGTGPYLWGVMGRDVAEVDGFRYSSAMQEYAEGGTEWMYQNMYDYLENPRGYVPGTAMSFAGLRDQEDRINIIAYMRSLGSSDLPLPEPLPQDDAEAPAEAEMGQGE
jgi:cytochrome c